jgi:hypothetical protein
MPISRGYRPLGSRLTSTQREFSFSLPAAHPVCPGNKLGHRHAEPRIDEELALLDRHHNIVLLPKKPHHILDVCTEGGRRIGSRSWALNRSRRFAGSRAEPILMPWTCRGDRPNSAAKSALLAPLAMRSKSRSRCSGERARPVRGCEADPRTGARASTAPLRSATAVTSRGASSRWSGALPD